MRLDLINKNIIMRIKHKNTLSYNCNVRGTQINNEYIFFLFTL